MTDHFSLLKNTGAYNAIRADKNNGTLSHAYLIVTPDAENLGEYLKILAKLITCKEISPCSVCRSCKAIDSDSYSDVLSYPKEKGSILSGDIENIISESYIKPIENDKKIFLLNSAETMNTSAQNKLLKTLEEPPQNVIILMGATTDYPLLPTVLSRVKKFNLPSFSDEMLFSALREECIDEEKLRYAIACGDGTVGRAKALYQGESLKKVSELVFDVLVNMKSSKDVLEFSNKIAKLPDFKEFVSILELTLRDLLYFYQGKENLIKNAKDIERLKLAYNFNTGSVLYALERITEANKRKKFNSNPVMLTEWLLFSILEGKYKWQKL